MACSSEICASFCTKTKQKLSLIQNNTNIIHFCQGGIQKELFSLARLWNLCTEHGHLLRERSPKRVAWPVLRVKWSWSKISYLKAVHHRFPFLNPFPAPEDVAWHQWHSSSHLPMQCCVTTSCSSSHVFSVSPCGTSNFEFFRLAATSFETVLGRN